jgi:hypothetical protein
VQDAGKAIHPTYEEGQMQGAAAQGIGWALNEEYIYGDDGRLQNPGFLDYRIPVCSDLPFIDTEILEIPNPNHPYGIRGVGETSIVPPLAAIGNAISNAVGVRMDHVPMSPPRILAALELHSSLPLVVAMPWRLKRRPCASSHAQLWQNILACRNISMMELPLRWTAKSIATTGILKSRKARRCF